MAISDEQVQVVGKIADTLDSLIAASAMRLPAEKKLEYTLATLEQLSGELKALFVEVSGENPWED